MINEDGSISVEVMTTRIHVSKYCDNCDAEEYPAAIAMGLQFCEACLPEYEELSERLRRKLRGLAG